jgi:hypothetical protein
MLFWRNNTRLAVGWGFLQSAHTRKRGWCVRSLLPERFIQSNNIVITMQQNCSPGAVTNAQILHLKNLKREIDWQI